MIDIKHILFPTDFSKSAGLAIKSAVGLAREYGAKLTLFHVLVPYMGESSDPLEHLPGDRKLGEILDELEDAAKGRLERHLEEHDIHGRLEVERVVVRGFSASNEILDHAKSRQIDLIVMGTHGRRGFSRVLLGSEAERVLRFAPCPVLTISRHASAKDLTSGIERILVPIDFSEGSRLAMRYGLALADRYGASVDLVHVFDEPVIPPFLMDHTGSYIATDPKMKDRCLESMDRELGKFPGVKSKVEKHVLEGRVSTTLEEFAKERETDLVVMGTRGLSGLDYLLLGSTAANMLRTAPCPVLTVHTDETEFVE